MSSADLSSLLNAPTVAVPKELPEARTVEELSPVMADLRVHLAKGGEPSKADLRGIVAYFRAFRRVSSVTTRAKAKGSKRIPKTIKGVAGQDVLDGLDDLLGDTNG